MDNIVAGIFGIIGARGLYQDHQTCKRFDHLCQTREEGGFQLLSGIVQSETPLEADTVSNTHQSNSHQNNSPQSIIRQIITHVQQIETKTIYESGTFNSKVPVTDTKVNWRINSKNLFLSPDIFLNTNHGGMANTNHGGVSNTLLVFDNIKYVQWDHTHNNINGSIRTVTDYFYNGRKRTLFGRPSISDPNSFDVKYIGNETNVLNKVKNDHYNINSGRTFCWGVCLVGSVAYLARNMINQF